MLEAPSLLRRLLAVDQAPPHPHQPDFNYREEGEFILIADGPRPVAVFSRRHLSMELREFYPDGRCGADFTIGRPYHKPRQHGLCLTFNWRIECQSVCSSWNQVTVEGGGATLRLRVDERFGADEEGFHLLEFHWDGGLGCYGVKVEAAVWLLRPYWLEVANFHARGVGEAWPELTEFTEVLWANSQGGLSWFPHTPLTPNTPGNMDLQGRRRIPAGGFLMFGRNPRYNPVLELDACHNEAIASATCNCYYDEHLMMGAPLPPIQGRRRYLWQAKYRFVSVGKERADALHGQAKLLDFGSAADYGDRRWLDNVRECGRQIQDLDDSYAFCPGVPSRFERPIRLDELVIGHYWETSPRANGEVRRVGDQGWKTPGALRLTGLAANATLTGSLAGPSITLVGDGGEAVRFSAMVKTDLEEGAEVWLELLPILFDGSEVDRLATSRKLSGENSWTRLEVEYQAAPGKDFVIPSLQLRGKGVAWFDEVLLEKI